MYGATTSKNTADELSQDELLADYLRYLAVNVGLEPLYGKRTPREMIEGYESPLLTEMTSRSLLEGGMARASPEVSIEWVPRTSQARFKTGADGSQPRKILGWNYEGGGSGGKDALSITVPKSKW